MYIQPKKKHYACNHLSIQKMVRQALTRRLIQNEMFLRFNLVEDVLP